MKGPLLEVIAVKLEIFSTFLISIFAIISEDKQLSTVGWALLGSVLGGFVFTYISHPPTYKEWFLRWAANICAGIVVGLVIAFHYESKAPDIPLSFFTMLCAFFAGPMTVIAIPIGLPVIVSSLKSAVSKFLKKP